MVDLHPCFMEHPIGNWTGDYREATGSGVLVHLRGTCGSGGLEYPRLLPGEVHVGADGVGGPCWSRDDMAACGRGLVAWRYAWRCVVTFGRR